LKSLALIPARGGSKGIPRKNALTIAGRPLIAWTIEAALASAQFDAVVVSTDDAELARISRECGALVPFMRPAELSQDDTPSMPVILHALAQMGEPDTVTVLQPTSPLRNAQDIRLCLEWARSLNAEAVVSVSEPAQSPYWMFRRNDHGLLAPLLSADLVARRQDLPAVFALNGAIYFARTAWLRHHNTFVTDATRGYIMAPEKSLDIDTTLDWKIAELLLMDAL